MTDDNATPLHRTLARDILDLLRERGTALGERLSRAALAETLGVSRTPVKGAVALLEEIGAVRTEGRSVVLCQLEGIEIPPLGPEDSENAVARLLVRIARGRADGSVPDEVSERQLAQHLGVSRHLVVQALSQLAESGVATRNRGHGWHFTAGFRDLEERAASYRFRMLIEPAALLEPGFALPPGFAARMRREHERFRDRPWREDDAVAFYEVNAQFHLGLAEASGNRFIAAAVAQQNRVRTLSNLSFTVGAARVPVNIREHLAILDALVVGDRERAALLMRLHLTDAMNLRPTRNA
ncbi:GntR family transcriptional regulator [Roseomonas sp. GC11]|uniref:GntR family transcriptional regulator n=1 Tax=Roseomonas sp. GC11 TaxID=2950546 RepID=UPI002109C948|nr:GntR family transcriptional regulator [Roseomonas sp. GC11]MCQ4161843.1 GntR family transcriptional regulator [Roseomonas sp. GC11]